MNDTTKRIADLEERISYKNAHIWDLEGQLAAMKKDLRKWQTELTNLKEKVKV